MSSAAVGDGFGGKIGVWHGSSRAADLGCVLRTVQDGDIVTGLLQWW